MKLPHDELREIIADRTLSPRVDVRGQRALAIEVRTSGPVPAHLQATIDEELHAGAAFPFDRVIAPRGARIGDRAILLDLEPIDPDAVRLDTLLFALRLSGSPLGSPLSARVIIDLCDLLEQIHGAPGFRGAPRVHGEVHAGAVLILSSGGLAIVGDGRPALSSILLCPPRRAEDRRRFLAPEAREGARLDVRADVYSLAVLYFELLSGARFAGVELLEALPDPREGLVRILRMALEPDRDRRLADVGSLRGAVLADLATAKIALPAHGLLERLVAEFVPAGAERGDDALSASDHDPQIFEALMSGAAETYPAPPAVDPARAATEPARAATEPERPADGWSGVLGQTFDDDPPTVEQRPAEAPPPRPSIPLPEDAPTIDHPRSQPGGIAPLEPPRLRATRPPERPSDLGRKKIRPASTKEAGPLRWVLTAAGLLLAVAVIFGVRARPTHRDEGEQADAGTIAVAAADAGAPIIVEDAGPPAPVGLLSVLSKPSGATVELDGGYIGRTPLVLKHAFQNKPYRLTVRADGYLVWEKIMRPDRRLESISVMATLEPKP
jgi:hypothetical protein